MTVIHKLTPQQWDILSLLFILMEVKLTSIIGDLVKLKYFIQKWITPFVPSLTKKQFVYEHIEYTNCACRTYHSRHILSDFFWSRYPGLFSNGLSKNKDSYVVAVVKKTGSTSLLIPCYHNKDLWHFDAIDEDIVAAHLP
ncbi:MAG: LPO_1073/Vpar_1526 family protein [Bacillota bacterium]